jgi:molybdopterin/thiamine biosynthesis adenylyltransferase
VSATARQTWYEREPERLAWELDEFARNGLKAEVSHDEEQHLVVETEVIFCGEPVGVRVQYSHGHPYFAPTVFGDARLLDRHQDPVTLNYCLLEDPRNDWHPSRSAGRLVGKNLRQLLKDTEAGVTAIREGEANQAEPISSQFAYGHPAVVLVPEPFLALELQATSGALTFARTEDLRLRVLSEASGIGSAEPELVARLVPEPQTWQGRWVALEQVVPERLPAKRFLAAVAEVDNTTQRRLKRRLKEKKSLDVAYESVGVTFLEQGPTRDEQRRTWLFAEVSQRRGKAPEVLFFTQAQAVTKAERQRRIPELAGLDAARVVVVGAGSLGAPVALELAKAGVGVLDIVDCDIYDANNTVRHVVDLTEAGNEKTALVGERCRALNPFVDVRVHETLLGVVLDEEDLLEELVNEATVIIDTTGSQSLARLLSDRCRAAGTPLVVAGLTAASYGGEIFVIGDGACFECFVLAQEEGQVPKPPEGERSAVTPVGCRHPAFAGAGFEATELAAITARTAIRAAGVTQYPPLVANWILLNFRGDPHYQDGFAALHGGCPAHQEPPV